MLQGESYEPLTFVVAEEYNEQYVFAQTDYSERYLPSPGKEAQAHPGLLMQMLSNTRSPSYWIPGGIGAILGSAQTKFLRPAYVGREYKVTWTVTQIYPKREKQYHEITATMYDSAGDPVMERKLHVTYVPAAE